MAKVGRPKVEILWDQAQNKFAREFLVSLWGGPLPAFIDPVKKVSRIVRSLTREEQKFWRGTVFLRWDAPSLRERLLSAIREWTRKHRSKDQTALEFCGFSLKELVAHVEGQFEPWMSWDNWGEWHIDHVIPRSMYGKPHSRADVFGLKNLRPISRAANLKKGNKYHG